MTKDVTYYRYFHFGVHNDVTDKGIVGRTSLDPFPVPWSLRMGKGLHFKMFAQCLRESTSSLRSHRSTMERILNGCAKVPKGPGRAELDRLQAVRDRVAEIENELKGYSVELFNVAARLSRGAPDNENSTQNLEEYRLINDKLAIVEKKVKKDLEKISRKCLLLIRRGIIEDYEIEVVMFFCLAEDDPDYLEDDDNFIAVLNFDGKHELSSDFGLDDGQNHNIFQQENEHPMKGDHHGYLFHCLYDHTHLNWEEILRINEVWLEIMVRYQNFIHLKR